MRYLIAAFALLFVVPAFADIPHIPNVIDAAASFEAQKHTHITAFHALVDAEADKLRLKRPTIYSASEEQPTDVGIYIRKGDPTDPAFSWQIRLKPVSFADKSNERIRYDARLAICMLQLQLLEINRILVVQNEDARPDLINRCIFGKYRGSGMPEYLRIFRTINREWLMNAGLSNADDDELYANLLYLFQQLGP